MHEQTFYVYFYEKDRKDSERYEWSEAELVNHFPQLAALISLNFVRVEFTTEDRTIVIRRLKTDAEITGN